MNYFVVVVQDVTEKRQSEETIWRQANFDPLTGLPNRRMFADRLEQEIKKQHQNRLPLALMLIDLDRFKEVNDTLGHAKGDALLVQAARRIGGCVRESDTVARLGGDEFMIILSELPDVQQIETLANALAGATDRGRSTWVRTAVYLSASIGITLYPEDASDAEQLIRNADQAMYAAKGLGRNRFSYFTSALQDLAQTRQRLSHDLRSALAEHKFELYFQPIVDLGTNRIVKAEALLRWQHPAARHDQSGRIRAAGRGNRPDTEHRQVGVSRGRQLGAVLGRTLRARHPDQRQHLADRIPGRQLRSGQPCWSICIS